MGDVINLNRARKARARDDQKRQSEENRVRFGRSKGEKTVAAAAAEKTTKELDGKKVD